jgi:hypothetical protein
VRLQIGVDAWVKVLAEQDQRNSWWPQQGDTLFASGVDWESEALIDVSSQSFLTYALGYKEAADSVVATVENRGLAADLAVYPACFLYRHYIELMLKGLIKLGNLLQGTPAAYEKTHQIRELWNTCRPLLEDAEADPVDVQNVEKCIFEFASIDPSGEAFRYSEDKKGNPVFKERMQFNLAQMRDVMKRLSGFFDGSYDYMDELLQYKDEE